MRLTCFIYINYRCIFFAFCAPELLTFVKSARVYLMRKNSWAPFKYFIVVFGFETLHTIGVAILFYAVLPNLDTLRAGMVTSGILLFPSLLSIFRSTRSSSSKKKYVTLGLDGESLLLFLFVQIRKRNITFWPFWWYWWTQTMHKTSYEQKWSHFSNVQLDDSAQRLKNLQFLIFWISRHNLIRLHNDLRSFFSVFTTGFVV